MSLKSCLRWHGGKFYVAKQAQAYIPFHRRYCESFFGSGAMLFQSDGENVAEFVNDLDLNLTNFWLVLKQPELYEKFKREIDCVPLSQYEFEGAAGYPEPLTISVPHAVAFFIRNRQSRQGLGRDYCTPTRRLRRGMNEQVSAWLTAVEGLPEVHERLKRVEIRNQPAIEFIKELDTYDCFHYVDPPYLHSTRSTTTEYGAFEMSEAEHVLLLKVLRQVAGKVMLSGYQSELYDDLLHDWFRVDVSIPNNASSASEKERKTECLYMNYPPSKTTLQRGTIAAIDG